MFPWHNSFAFCSRSKLFNIGKLTMESWNHKCWWRDLPQLQTISQKLLPRQCVCHLKATHQRASYRWENSRRRITMQSAFEYLNVSISQPAKTHCKSIGKVCSLRKTSEKLVASVHTMWSASRYELLFIALRKFHLTQKGRKLRNCQDSMAARWGEKGIDKDLHGFEKPPSGGRRQPQVQHKLWMLSNFSLQMCHQKKTVQVFPSPVRSEQKIQLFHINPSQNRFTCTHHWAAAAEQLVVSSAVTELEWQIEL